MVRMPVCAKSSLVRMPVRAKSSLVRMPVRAKSSFGAYASTCVVTFDPLTYLSVGAVG